MLSLEDAIKHAEEVAKDCETAVECGIMNCLSDEENVDNISECAMEHRQLAEWLKELKRYREAWQKVREELKEEMTGLDMFVEKKHTIRWVLRVIDNALGQVGETDEN